MEPFGSTEGICFAQKLIAEEVRLVRKVFLEPFADYPFIKNTYFRGRRFGSKK
jgi:hypothetical protein